MKVSSIVAAIEHQTSIGTSFVDALKHLLSGKAISRNDWHPSEVVYLMPGAHSFEHSPDLVNYIDNIDREHFESWSPGIVTRLPTFCKALANGSNMEGWVPNAEEMLTEDWILR